MDEQVVQERERWRRDLLRQIEKKFELDKNSFCVVGSFSLDLFGIKEMGDIDLCVLPAKMEEKEHKISNGNIAGFKVESIGENRGFLAFLQKIGLSEEELINNARYHFLYHGYKIIRPELSYAEKLYRCTKLSHIRPKDFQAITLFERYLRTNTHPGYVWTDSLSLFPASFLDRLRVRIYHPLFKLLFRFGFIERNWTQISRLFWYLRYRGLKNTLEIIYSRYAKRSRK